jgi:hypothetical protein
VPGFHVFCQPSVKLSDAGRPSGGVVCLVKNEFVQYVKQIKVNVGNFLLFVIDKCLFGFAKDVLYVCAYTPPEGSRYYSFLGVDGDGIALLEECLVDNALIKNDFFVILSGDLNGRTSNFSQIVTRDYDSFDNLSKSSCVSSGRNSQDSVLNGFGKSLLNMCTALNLCILNGMCHGDLDGRYTYICDSGSSVIDYFLMSSDLFATVWDNCCLNVLDRSESYHMPVVLSLACHTDVGDDYDANENIFIEKFIWTPENVDVFRNAINTDVSRQTLRGCHQNDR